MELLSKITPSIVHNILDRWTSTHLSDGKYYPSSAYKWLVTQGNHLPPSIPHVLFKWLWKIRIPKKGKMMFGLILHNSLPTNVTRRNRHLSSDASCPIALTTMRMSFTVWEIALMPRKFGYALGLLIIPIFLSIILRIGSGFTWWAIMGSCSHFLAIVWWVWKWRNKRIFKEDYWHVLRNIYLLHHDIFR